METSLPMSVQLWNRRIAELTGPLSPAARALARSLGLRPEGAAGLGAFCRARAARPLALRRLSVRFEARRVRWGRRGIRFAYSSCRLQVDGLSVARLLLGSRREKVKRLFVSFQHASPFWELGEAPSRHGPEEAPPQSPEEAPLPVSSSDSEDYGLAPEDWLPLELSLHSSEKLPLG